MKPLTPKCPRSFNPQMAFVPSRDKMDFGQVLAG